MGLEFKAKERRRLTPGVHLVTIKDLYIARERKPPALPLVFTDPTTGEEYGAVEMVFMDKSSTGIKEKFLLGDRQRWVLDKLLDAIDRRPPAGEQIDVERVKGCKLWVVVARCILYDKELMRTENDGTPTWYPKLLPVFYPAAGERPMLKGNPQDNEGICGEEFTIHQDSVLGLFNPTPNYVSREDLPQEGFGKL